MLVRLSVLLVLFSSGNSIGQVNRYVIYFKNKAGNQYSVSQPAKFLSAASITRRAKQQISYTEEDLPVTAGYVNKLKDIGAKVFFTSRWLNCVLVESTPSIANAASQLPEVSKVELVAPGNRLLGGRVSTKFDQKVIEVTAPSLVQFQQLGIDEMNSEGYNGEGINIAIFDGGFLGVNTTSAFQAARSKIKYEYNFVVNSKNVYLYDDHGTEVFSVLSAQTPDFVGGSLGANYFLFLTEDKPTEYRVEEFNWLFAAERADSLGVDIISSSLGYSTFDDATMNYRISDLTGNNAIVSIAASKALAKGMMVVTSAGNEGNGSWKYITPPADAAGILSVGSITSEKLLSGFSSLGPTADGRFKPDVVALGSSTTLINQSGSLVKGSGTSFSCPLITCLVAGLWQAYPNLKAQEIYTAIIRSADQAYNPDNKKGFGLPNFKAVVNYLKRTALDQAIVISPNPVETSLNVTFKEPKEEEVVITMFSVLGQSLFTTTTRLNWQKNPMEYDLSNLASGVYIVQIKSLSQSLTSRIIKL